MEHQRVSVWVYRNHMTDNTSWEGVLIGDKGKVTRGDDLRRVESGLVYADVDISSGRERRYSTVIYFHLHQKVAQAYLSYSADGENAGEKRDSWEKDMRGKRARWERGS